MNHVCDWLGCAEFMLEVLRNVTCTTSAGVMHAAVTAVLNAARHASTRQDLVTSGIVDTL